MKLTPWFTNEQPVNEGVYERDMSSAYDDDSRLIYSYFKDGEWKLSGFTPQEATDLCKTPSTYQNFPWRGLVKE